MKKIKILWVGYNCPVKCDKQAGSQTFYHYFRDFINDGRFSIRLIALGKSPLRDKSEEELSDIRHAVRYSDGSKITRLKNPINWESTFNILFNKRANMIQNSDAAFILGKARVLKDKGYEPDFIILEWTNTVVLAQEFKNMFPYSRIVANEDDLAYIGFMRNMQFFKGIHNKVRWFIRYKRCKKVEIKSLMICDLIIPQNYDNRNDFQKEGIPEDKILSFTPFYNNLLDVNRRPNKGDILFFGDMSRGENEQSAIWFIENVMPILIDEDVRFIVMGGNPSERIKSLATDRIIITGYVDSIRDYFETAMCFVAPLVLGAGIKVKVMEALSSGIPVLTNHIGIEGIPARNGLDYLHCERPEDFSKAIISIKRGEIDTDSLSLSGRELMRERFSLDDSVERYKNRLVSMMQSVSD